MNPENMPIIGWARPIAVALAKYCGVVAMGASIVTSCRGRWSLLEPTHYLVGRDREVDEDGIRFTKCEACDDNARIQQSLAPVDCPVDNTSRGSTSAIMTAPDWDLSDLGGDS